MLCGRTYHTMDTKNRIIIPQALRSEMGDVVYVTVGYDNNLFVMSDDTFNKLAEKVLGVAETSVEAREFRRTFFGDAVMCQLDKTGRLILPQLLIVAAIILPMEVSFSKSLTLIMTSSILHDILSIIRSIRDTLLSHFIKEEIGALKTSTVFQRSHSD